MNMNTFKVENDSSDIADPIPLNDDSVKLEIDETENVPLDSQNVMTVKAEIDESEIGKFFEKPRPDLQGQKSR